jgi:GNAT superfamily N-acetyltransferase
MLEHLVDDVDGVDHIALVLCAETSPRVYDPVALARMVRYADVGDAADLAVTVKDEWQGRGVATALLEVLMRRRPPGVDRIVTEVLQDNPASLGMLRHLGAVSLEDEGNGVYGVVVRLEPLDPVGTPVEAPVTTPSPAPARRSGVRPTPLLHDPRHRHELRTRDQVCPWFT